VSDRLDKRKTTTLGLAPRERGGKDLLRRGCIETPMPARGDWSRTCASSKKDEGTPFARENPERATSEERKISSIGGLRTPFA